MLTFSSIALAVATECLCRDRIVFSTQPATLKGGHKSEDCANLVAFATTNGLTGKARIYAAACEKMRKLNKVLVKELVREKFFVKKLAPALPGGSFFRP